MTIVTPHPYSYLRLLSLAREFSMDLSACKLMAENEFLLAPCPDLLVAMGNQVIPPIAARATNSVYMCQFPFSMSREAIRDTKGLLEGYRCIIANSEYAKAYFLARLSAFQLPALPVEVIHPPVPSIGGDASRKKPIILSVGRFFRDKRHDVMISAFRSLTEQSNEGMELHLAGSSIPHQMDYLGHLREMAAELPVLFHVNAPSEELFGLYRDAAIYWHGTGLEVDLDRQPNEAEHFRITIVEAMSAQCVPLAFNAGGPRDPNCGMRRGLCSVRLIFTVGIFQRLRSKWTSPPALIEDDLFHDEPKDLLALDHARAARPDGQARPTTVFFMTRLRRPHLGHGSTTARNPPDSVIA